MSDNGAAQEPQADGPEELKEDAEDKTAEEGDGDDVNERSVYVKNVDYAAEPPDLKEHF